MEKSGQFSEKFIHNITDSHSQIIEGVYAKNLEAALFYFIHREKMEKILLAHGLSKETVTSIMMLYRNTKAKVHSLDGNTDFFDSVSGVLHGDTLGLYLFIIY